MLTSALYDPVPYADAWPSSVFGEKPSIRWLHATINVQSQISENALFQQQEELIRRKIHLPIEAITSIGNGNWDLCATSLAEPSAKHIFTVHIFGSALS